MQSTQKQLEKAETGKRLAKARESLGLKQRELAEILGYETYSPIKDIETGVTQLKKPLAKLIEVMVGIRENWLLDGELTMVGETSNVFPANLSTQKTPIMICDLDRETEEVREGELTGRFALGCGTGDP